VNCRLDLCGTFSAFAVRLLTCGRGRDPPLRRVADQCEPRLACTASHSYLSQIAVALAIIACAVVVACALVASSDLRGKRVALYGIGSGEETEANNAADVAFGTFANQEEIVEEAGANYKELNEEIEESPEFAETLEEVEEAIEQGTAEGALLAHYYAGNDSPPVN
jgi:hypothetical protein